MLFDQIMHLARGKVCLRDLASDSVLIKWKGILRCEPQIRPVKNLKTWALPTR